MNRAVVERACFDLKDDENAERFRQSPETFLAAYPLSDAERVALTSGDIAALYRTDIALFALAALAKAHRYSRTDYVARLRAGLGLPEDAEQARLLDSKV
jgi:hypothetical protein